MSFFKVLFVFVLCYLPGIALAGESILLNQCFECHGKTGEPGRVGTMPIGGMDKADIISKLKGYRSQRVPDSVMSRGVHDLNDEDIEAVADYYSKVDSPMK
jgi:cytochrome c553